MMKKAFSQIAIVEGAGGNRAISRCEYCGMFLIDNGKYRLSHPCYVQAEEERQAEQEEQQARNG